MSAITATPVALKDAYPCLYCLSDKEIYGIILHLLRISATTVETGPQLITNSACFVRQMGKKDMLVALTAMLIAQFSPGSTPSQLKTASKCTACEPDKAIQGKIMYLLAKYYQGAIL